MTDLGSFSFGVGNRGSLDSLQIWLGYPPLHRGRGPSLFSARCFVRAQVGSSKNGPGWFVPPRLSVELCVSQKHLGISGGSSVRLNSG